MALTYEMGLIDGRQEVVKWMQAYAIEYGEVDFGGDEWQAKLKEWDIE